VAKVVVVGSTNTDMTVRVSRIPAPGETVLGRDFRITAGGKGANQAVAAARAGAIVVFVTALGTDDFGNRALENFGREAIDVRLVRRVSSGPSGVALIFVDDAGENSIAVAPGANGDLRPEDVSPLAHVLDAGDVMLVQLEIPLATVEAAVRIAAARRARVMLNPAPAQALPDSLLSAVSLITPNEHEAERLTGVVLNDDAGAPARAAATLHERGVAGAIITLGARGAFVSSDTVSEHVRAFSVAAVDTTAAGDVFNGAMAAALVEGRLLREAVQFANAAAAISVTRPGAQDSAPTRSAIDDLLCRHPYDASTSH
jgi:ribokinase